MLAPPRSPTLPTALALALGAWAGLAWAGSAGAQEASSTREVAGLPAGGGAAGGAADGAGRAREEALGRLGRDAGDVAALLLLGRAELDLGDAEAALGAARRAHAEAGDGRARFAAARLAARAHAGLGQDTRAMIWLRRARADAPDAEAVRDLARDYRLLRARNPLAASLSFGVAPSSNVNGGSAAATIVLPGLPFEFVLNEEARALSGVRVSGGGTLAWRFQRGERAETALEAQVSGRTYVLSGEARERAPEARGADYADVAASASLVRRWRPAGSSGPSSASLAGGRTWYDGSPFLDFAQASFGRSFALGERDRFLVTELVERTWRLDDEEAYWSLGGRVRWSHALRSGNLASLSAGVRDALSELPDVAYDGATLGVGHEWRRPVGLGPVRGLRLGVGLEAEWRRYAASSYAAGGREDWTWRLRGTVGLPRLDLYGFYPSVSLEASRTESDVALFDRQGLTLDVGFRSSF